MDDVELWPRYIYANYVNYVNIRSGFISLARFLWYCTENHANRFLIFHCQNQKNRGHLTLDFRPFF